MAERELWVQMEFQVRVDEDRLRDSATYPQLDGAGRPAGVTTDDPDHFLVMLIVNMLEVHGAEFLRQAGVEVGQSSGRIIEKPH